MSPLPIRQSSTGSLFQEEIRTYVVDIRFWKEMSKWLNDRTAFWQRDDYLLFLL